MKCCKRCVVSGKVQGVFFRNATQKQAIKHGVKGWVRNLANGDVECVLCGEEEIIAKLCAWLWEGPPAAKVTHVDVEEIPWEEYGEFVILR